MVDSERVRWLADRHIKRHHAFSEKAYARVSKDAKLPYDRLKHAAVRTGWLQLLVANMPLYERAAGKTVVTEKEMLKWSDELFDLIFEGA
jgi:hypothetical protein